MIHSHETKNKMKLTDFKIGDKVHYIPFDGCDQSKYENGRVKEIPDVPDHVRVVYNCAGQWDNFMLYTSALTPISKLKMGWV